MKLKIWTALLGGIFSGVRRTWRSVRGSNPSRLPEAGTRSWLPDPCCTGGAAWAEIPGLAGSNGLHPP